MMIAARQEAVDRKAILPLTTIHANQQTFIDNNAPQKNRKNIAAPGPDLIIILSSPKLVNRSN